PEDGLERRRLAGGVAAEQAHELAGLDPDREPAQDVDLPVVRVDAVELEQRRGAHRRLRRAYAGHFVAVVCSPRQASTTFSCLAPASKGPSAIFTPWSSATTRSEMPSTTCMSCSMTRIV